MKLKLITLIIPRKWFFVFVSAYGALLLLDLFLGQYRVEGEIVPFRLFMIIFGSIAFGVYRAFIFHPESNKRYGAWLASTPWKAGKELPNGPIRIAARDLVILGPLVALWMTEIATFASGLSAEYWYIHSILPIAAFTWHRI